MYFVTDNFLSKFRKSKTYKLDSKIFGCKNVNCTGSDLWESVLLSLTFNTLYVIYIGLISYLLVCKIRDYFGLRVMPKVNLNSASAKLEIIL